MSWTDLHQRNAIIDEVLARAERNPDDPELFRVIGIALRSCEHLIDDCVSLV